MRGVDVGVAGEGVLGACCFFHCQVVGSSSFLMFSVACLFLRGSISKL